MIINEKSIANKVLHHLLKYKSSTLSKISREENTTFSGAYLRIKDLEAIGLVKKKKITREVMITLTEKGRAIAINLNNINNLLSK